MPRSSDDYREAVRLCRESGFSENRVYSLCCLLLFIYRDTYLAAKEDNEIKEMTPEEIAVSKRECRDLFLYLFTKTVEESLEEQQQLIDRLIKLIWFREKIDYILEQVANFKGNGYGYAYKMIIKMSYFDEVYRTNKDIYTSLGPGVKKTNFYAKRKTGIILFGIKMWRYVLRRQKEEMEAGIIPFKELPKPQENLGGLPPIESI